MKTFVIAKSNYRDELLEGGQYELVHEFATTEVRSGVAYVVNFPDELRVYDSSFFRFTKIKN